MKEDKGFETLGEIFAKKKQTKKPPAYEWQDLALKIIIQLAVPANKKSSVFKICKTYPKERIQNALDETKELAQKEKWRYFFKVITNISKVNSNLNQQADIPPQKEPHN